MSKLMDAAVTLYHKRERQQVNRFFDAFGEAQFGNPDSEFEATNYRDIWEWGWQRWKRAFVDREYEMREANTERFGRER